MRRRVVGLAFLLVLTGTMIGAILATGFASRNGGWRWVIVGATVLVVMVVAFGARRAFGRSWTPVGELIEATTRLGEGETDVRMGVDRPGPFAAVARSFNHMAGRLEDEEQRRRRFLADIGHELRTPMTVIRGGVEAVLDGVRDADTLSNVVEEIDLMDRLLDDLRLLALAEAGRLELDLEPTDVGGLVADVANSFSARATDQDVVVTIQVESALPETMTDQQRMRQVLSNLISNALKQMPDGGRLAVSVDRADDLVVVEVADNGVGIPAGEEAQIFERFVRAGDSAGTGLGLSISRDLIEAHGGTLTANNGDIGGAVFTATIPIPGT